MPLGAGDRSRGGLGEPSWCAAGARRRVDTAGALAIPRPDESPAGCRRLRTCAESPPSVCEEDGLRRRRDADSARSLAAPRSRVAGRAFAASPRLRGLAAAFFTGFAGSSSGGRQRIRSFPRCCTAAAASASAMLASICSRSARSSENTRTLISACARSATSISCITCGVSPCCPMLTTGCSGCACARNSRRCFEVSGIIAAV